MLFMDLGSQSRIEVNISRLLLLFISLLGAVRFKTKKKTKLRPFTSRAPAESGRLTTIAIVGRVSSS